MLSFRTICGRLIVILEAEVNPSKKIWQKRLRRGEVRGKDIGTVVHSNDDRENASISVVGYESNISRFLYYKFFSWISFGSESGGADHKYCRRSDDG
jgi:hypothetical protein